MEIDEKRRREVIDRNASEGNDAEARTRVGHALDQFRALAYSASLQPTISIIDRRHR